MTDRTIPFIAPKTGRQASIQARFEELHQNNPEVYAKLIDFAREIKAAGKTEYGIEDLFARLGQLGGMNYVTSTSTGRPLLAH